MAGHEGLPRLTATIGLHASASTWVFNVVRELLIAVVGEALVSGLYADRVDQVRGAAARAGQYLVIKSHPGSAELDAWLAAEGARLFVSVRDLRDAAVSMAQRFAAPLAHTVRWLADDCTRLLRLTAREVVLLRYEDRFFDTPSSIEMIAAALGLRAAPGTTATIFARYQTEAVRRFAQTLTTRPPDGVTMVGAFPMDPVTQILAPHIGDGSSGKWRHLPAPVSAELTRVFAPFLERFGYAT